MEDRPGEPSSGRRTLRSLRGHVTRALVPALALAVLAGSTAGAVTIVALSGAVVTSDGTDVASDDGADAMGAADGSEAADAAAATDPDGEGGATPDGSESADDGTDATGDGSESADGTEDDAEERTALSFEETVAVHGRPDYSAILSRMFPGAQWSLSGDAYTGLRWLDGAAKPTRAELDALWPEVAAALEEERLVRVAATLAANAARAATLEERRNDPAVQALVDAIDPRTIWGPQPDYSAILSRRFPGAQWSLNGNDPAGGLVWHDGGTAPTKAQLDAMWAEVAREMAFELDPVELERRAGVGDQMYVDGVLRPKGWVGGANDPQPAPVATRENLQYLPQIAHTNGGSPVGTITVDKDPTGSQNFEQRYGVQLHELGAMIAEAHGYFGGSHGLGLSLNGDKELMWYSDEVDPSIVEQVLAGLGAVPTPPPAPEPEPEPVVEEPEPEPAAEEPAAEE